MDADAMGDRLARLDAMIEVAKRLPSWPEMARTLQTLTQALADLQHRVATLERECDALRQRELLRLWDTEPSEP